MRVITVVFVFSLISLSAAMMDPSMKGIRKGKWRGGGRSNDRRECQRLPRPMSLQRFRDEVTGDGFTEVLNTRNSEIGSSARSFHLNIFYNETNTKGEFIIRATARPEGDTGDGVCPVRSFGLSVFDKTRDFALFGIAGFPYDVSYFSQNPSNYLFEVFCNETRGDNPGRQCCTGDWDVALYSNHDPPHFLDWKGASRDLWRQMRICMTDNFFFTYQLNVCETAIP